MKVRSMLGQQTAGIAQISRETGLTRHTVYRIKDDPAGAESALGVWGLIEPGQNDGAIGREAEDAPRMPAAPVVT
jgi:hypothetical protein